MKREFTIAELQDLGIPYAEGECVLSDELRETRRWSITHRSIFRHEDRLWEVLYDEPATEYQDIEPWEWEPVTAHEVEAFEETITVYRRKED